MSDFSPDPRSSSASLWDLEASGQTALFDAVAATPEKMMKGRNNKRAILLFTDGVDNASAALGRRRWPRSCSTYRCRCTRSA